MKIDARERGGGDVMGLSQYLALAVIALVLISQQFMLQREARTNRELRVALRELREAMRLAGEVG